jgi:hypothetical protein
VVPSSSSSPGSRGQRGSTYAKTRARHRRHRRGTCGAHTTSRERRASMPVSDWQASPCPNKPDLLARLLWHGPDVGRGPARGGGAGHGGRRLDVSADENAPPSSQPAGRSLASQVCVVLLSGSSWLRLSGKSCGSRRASPVARRDDEYRRGRQGTDDHCGNGTAAMTTARGPAPKMSCMFVRRRDRDAAQWLRERQSELVERACGRARSRRWQAALTDRPRPNALSSRRSDDPRSHIAHRFWCSREASRKTEWLAGQNGPQTCAH